MLKSIPNLMMILDLGRSLNYLGLSISLG